MSNIVPTQQRDLITFSDEKRELIRRTVASNLNADEFELLMAVAAARGLDPILKQIYGVKRDGKMTIQTAIDGYRLIAARTNEYAGSDEPIFQMNNGKPDRCKITVYRIVQGQRCAFTATAFWSEYFPGDKLGFMWKKMPHTMLAKVTEALALRKAFPADLSGLHVDEEMQQAGEPDRPRDVTPPANNQRDVSPADDGIRAAKEDVQRESGDDPGSHVIGGGKRKGQTLRNVMFEVGLPATEKYIQSLEGLAREEGRPLRTWERFLKVAFERYKPVYIMELEAKEQEFADEEWPA